MPFSLNVSIMMWLVRRAAIAGIAAAMIAAEMPLAHAEQILKCVGADGRIEFATRCAPGTHEQVTGIDPQPNKAGGGNTPHAKSAVDLEFEFQKRQADRRDAEAREQKEQAAAEARSRNCTDARRSLATTTSGRRLATTDPDTGDRIYLTPDEVTQAGDKARSDMQANCN